MMARARFFGRPRAFPVAFSGTDTENEVPGASNSIDVAGGPPSQGDIIYHNGTSWVRLAAGTSGHFLKTLGSGANPAWAAAGGSSVGGDLYLWQNYY
jgi:hypothetical protein